MNGAVPARVDLHLHTWVSDGEVSPADAVKHAVQGGLDVIAVTDHDTAAGVIEAQLAAAETSVSVVAGIEISTRLGDQELHVLGYWIDPLAPSILQHQERAVQRRFTRMVTMVERLQGMGIAITVADVESAAGPSARTLGRPHLARALHLAGHTRFYGEAFTRFIGDDCPAFVAEGFPPPEEAIEIIHAAGGIASLAHPPLAWIHGGIRHLVDHGLDAMECYRPGMEPGDITGLEELARQYGLLFTGGSDWHGPQRARLGEFAVAAGRVRRALAVGGIAA